VLNPGLRASASDRQRYADCLGAAYATEQLDDAELSARLEAVFHAKTMGDLAPIVADLNFATMGAPVPSTTGALPVPAQAAAKPVRRRGRHRVAKIVAAVAAAAVVVVGVTAAHNVWNDYQYYKNSYISMMNAQPPNAVRFPGYYDPGVYPQPADAMDYQIDRSVPLTDIDRLPNPYPVTGESVEFDLSGLSVTHDATMSLNLDAGGAAHLVLPRDGNVVVNYLMDPAETGFLGGEGNPVDPSQWGGSHAWTPDPGGPVLTIDVTSNDGSGVLTAK
jgi:hypothetical protein